jgi:hypothetical protein
MAAAAFSDCRGVTAAESFGIVIAVAVVAATYSNEARMTSIIDAGLTLNGNAAGPENVSITMLGAL